MYLLQKINTADVHAQVNVSVDIAHHSQPDTLVVYSDFSLRSG